jgi:hypothetical protein
MQAFTFTRAVTVNADPSTVFVIPAGSMAVRIALDSENGADLDLALFDIDDSQTYPEGKALVGWCGNPLHCNQGALAGPDQASMQWLDAKVVYSGYNGVANVVGTEFIEIEGPIERPLMVKARAYAAAQAQAQATVQVGFASEIEVLRESQRSVRSSGRSRSGRSRSAPSVRQF